MAGHRVMPDIQIGLRSGSYCGIADPKKGWGVWTLPWFHISASHVLQSGFIAAVSQEVASILLNVIRKKIGKWDPHVHYEKSSA